jgi:hypothetical protein
MALRSHIIVVVLKVHSSNQQHQCHLRICLKSKCSGPTTDQWIRT